MRPKFAFKADALTRPVTSFATYRAATLPIAIFAAFDVNA
jgi:hypothetical protein